MYSSRKGCWKICDFGIASDGETNEARPTIDGRGTSGYRAPEILSESRGQYTNKADIWALGCIVFELCAGRRPFADDFAVKKFEFELPTTSLPIQFKEGLSDEFCSVVTEWIHAMLQRNPQDRPSAESLGKNLGTLFNAMCPDVKIKPKQQWISKTKMLGTDGPMPDRIISWDDVFFPGTFQDVVARYDRDQQIHKARSEILGSKHAATRWSAERLAWAATFMGHIDLAETLFKQLIKEGSKYRDRKLLALEYGLAQCYQWKEKYDPARMILEQLVKQSRKSVATSEILCAQSSLLNFTYLLIGCTM